MKKFVSYVMLSFFFSAPVFAKLNLPPIPQKCPSVAALIAGGISRTVIQIDNRWFAGRRHMNYDTTNVWTFIVANMPVTNAKDAYDFAAASLPSIQFKMGPFSSSDHWVCLYNTNVHNLPAVTITDPIALQEAPKYFE